MITENNVTQKISSLNDFGQLLVYAPTSSMNPNTDMNTDIVCEINTYRYR